MYIVYFAKGTFCTKHPYQGKVGKLQLNIGEKFKLFLVSSIFSNIEQMCSKIKSIVSCYT